MKCTLRRKRKKNAKEFAPKVNGKWKREKEEKGKIEQMSGACCLMRSQRLAVEIRVEITQRRGARGKTTDAADVLGIR